jgi:hypothetical protein
LGSSEIAGRVGAVVVEVTVGLVVVALEVEPETEELDE